MTDGYQALHSGTALIELSDRGRIEVFGEDRARLIHALTTNHIQQLRPGEGAYAFFLTAQGRIIADAHVLCFEDKLLLDVEPETRAALFQHIDHYIIADDVTLDDATERTFAIGVEGPGAGALLEELGAALPATPESHLFWDGSAIARIAFTGAAGFRIYGEEQRHNEFVRRLTEAGAAAATRDEARVVRIENGLPRYGEDIANSTLPQETGLAQALHFSKGCYLGQEIVERIRSRGRVNKVLAGLVSEAKQPFAQGAKITASGAETGEITSSAYSPSLGKTVAIAMLRVTNSRPGMALEVDGAPAVVRG